MRGAVRSLRGPKQAVSARHPMAVIHELERRPQGAIHPATTVFLVGRECPFTCVFCDLWKATLDADTPEGALPEQLREAI